MLYISTESRKNDFFFARIRVDSGLQFFPLHTISYDAPRCVANGGEMTFPSGYTPHMFAVTASSATSTLEIRVTDRFGNTYTETMKRPKTFSTDLNE